MSERNDMIVRQKTDELIASVHTLSEMLPEASFCPIRSKLRSSLNSVPKYIELGYRDGNRNFEKIKYFLNASCALDECKEYLGLVETLKYCSTKELIDRVDNVSDMLASDCPNIMLVREKKWEYKKAI